MCMFKKLQQTPSELRAKRGAKAYHKKHSTQPKKRTKKKVKRFKKPPYETRQELLRMKYPEFLKSKYWAHVRQLVLKRDGNACVICNRTCALQVHHDNYKYFRDELKHLDALMTLCRPCHEEHHYAQA